MDSSGESSVSKMTNIDLVIVEDESCGPELASKRDAFFSSLKNNFTIRIEPSSDQKLVYYLLSANLNILRFEAELIGLNGSIIKSPSNCPTNSTTAASSCQNIEKVCFSSAQRSRLAWSILQRASFGKFDQKFSDRRPSDLRSSEQSAKFNRIEKLLEQGVFLAAYPLHERIDSSELRRKLKLNWAAFSWTTPQPIVDIKDYFGEQTALYFAWLGFYTYMLFPLSVLGAIVFIINVLNCKSDPRVVDVCHREQNIILCPPCDNHCQYARLSDWCKQAILSSLSDNWLTLPFTYFVLMWALVFRVAWRRYVSRMSRCIDFIERNQTRQQQQQQPLHRTWLHLAANFEIIRHRGLYMFVKRVVIYGFVFAMGLAVLYVSVKILNLAIPLRAAVKANIEHETLTPLMGLIITSGISVGVIWVLNNVLFYYVAKWLTTLEMAETQTQFEHWLTLKLYIVQFVSYYFSVVYVALFQGRFIGRPNSYQDTYPKTPPDQCGPLGCFPELFVQMMCIMFLKPIFNNIFEYFAPSLKQSINIRRTRTKFRRKTPNIRFGPRPQWEKEFVLQQQYTPGLFYEYIEIIMQYGYVVMFSGAFPLAPLFAMLNNLFEIRLDAHKFLNKLRRPIAEPADDIGAWYLILGYLNKIAILVNGLLLAFGSDLVPRIYYSVVYERGLSGYVNFSLAHFDTMTYSANATHRFFLARRRQDLRQRFCRFPQFRDSPFSIGSGVSFSPDTESEQYWILLFRVAFIFVFENIAAVLDWSVELYFTTCPSFTSELEPETTQRSTSSSLTSVTTDPDESISFL